MATIRSFLKDTRGTTMIEYVVIACFLSILIIGGVSSVGARLNNLFFQPVSTNLT